MTLTIEIWFWPLDLPPEELATLAADLSIVERARAARFARPGLAAQFIAARGRMRHILADRMGRSPAALNFETGPHGKPALPGGPAFNLSHSGGWAALALGPPGLALGIDIECHRPVDDDLAGRVFTPAERSELAALAPSERLAGFHRGWTRKEAVLKALGTGLAMPLAAVAVTFGHADARLTCLAVEGESPALWQLADLPLGDGFSGALALRSAEAIRLAFHGTSLPLPRTSDGQTG
jgi:4'-phosphopantetheinyl transferase